MKPRGGPRRTGGTEWSRFGPLKFALWLPVVFLVVLAIGALIKHLPPAMPLFYVAASGLSFGLYARDKGKAQREQWRTPETVLHTFDLAAGWPGGLIAQRVYRHKTRKLSFQAIFWLTTLFHLGAWSWIFVSIPAEQDLARFSGRVARAAVAAISR